MCSADLVEITVKGDDVVVIGSDLVQLRNRLELLAEKEEKEMMDIRKVIDIATQAQEAQTKLEIIKKILENYKYSEDRIKGICAVVGFKENIE